MQNYFGAFYFGKFKPHNSNTKYYTNQSWYSIDIRALLFCRAREHNKFYSSHQHAMMPSYSTDEINYLFKNTSINMAWVILLYKPPLLNYHKLHITMASE